MALLIIPVLKRWSRARGPYGYLRTWNWPIAAREISQPYNKYMLFTSWEVRIGKNCDRGLNMLTEASGPRSQFFPIRTDHKPVNNLFIFSSNGQAHQEAKQRRAFFIKKMKILENLWQSSETFVNFGNSSKVFAIAFMIFWKFSENLRKTSEIFGKFRKRFKSNFHMIF